MKFILMFLVVPFFCEAAAIPASELIKMSENYSPQVKGENFNLGASESQVKQAKLLANPLFTYQGGMTRQGRSKGAVTDLTLNQPLPWPGKRQNRIEAQEFMLKLTELSKEEVKLEVAHRIYVLSAEIAALQELESHYAERKRRFLLIEKSLRSRPQVSPKQRVDRDLIESQIALMEKSMLDLIARKDYLVWELKIFTNSSVERVSFPWKVLPKALPKDEYFTLLDSSPKAQRMKVEGRLAENKIEQARLEARPDIMVGVNYRNENVIPQNNFYHGQVTVVIPIIDHGQHSMQTARALQKRTDALHSVQRNEYASLIHQYFALYEASRKAMGVFELSNLHNVEKKFFDAEVSFRKGFIDALTFLQIDSQIHENIDQIYLSRVSYVAALSQLNLLVGKAPEL